MFGSMSVRRENTIYVSLWYYIATYVGIAVMYIFNNLSIPTYFVADMGSVWHSISMYSGSNDALIQWWWGHNAVAFVFTSGVIGTIYYFLPKESVPAYFFLQTHFVFFLEFDVCLYLGGRAPFDLFHRA